MSVTHAQETGTRNLHEKFDSSSSQFLALKQLSGQSRCTVRLTCLTVSMPEQSCVQLCARNLYQKNWNQIVQHTRASFWYQTTGSLVRVSGACVVGISYSYRPKASEPQGQGGFAPAMLKPRGRTYLFFAPPTPNNMPSLSQGYT